MSHIKTLFAVLLLFACSGTHAQLGFCAGSKGEPIFTENFGNGTTYGPALPAGTTTYPFVTGAPNDGQYTLYYHSNMYSTWHYSLDHTPDATNGPNGKMLLMNANAVTSGDFYKKVVTGLCVNTTFEFSAWLMNVYNPTTNYCGAGQIPINVRFEIWNASETILLGSGNTGNIMGSPTPTWQQFGLVFTTVSETSVVLKMKNNGLGGCGNDLAIDDIAFSACGDLTTVSSPLVGGTTYATCASPVSVELNAATASASPYFYQWQSSSDQVTWTDIPSATNPVYIAPNISGTTYFRVKAAQDAANLSNSFCSTISNVFTVSILASPNAPTSNGNVSICSNQAIPALTVTVPAGTGVNWYDAPSGGTLLQAASDSYTPTAAGTYYAETFNTSTNCTGGPRTPVSLSITPLPTATISGSTSICAGNTAVVTFSGTPNAIVTYAADGGPNQTIALNASGSASVTTPALSSNSTYTLISVSSPVSSSCNQTLSGSVNIAVTSTLTASISSNAPVCAGNSATITFNGTPNAVVSYTVNSGPSQTIALDAAGTASLTVPNVTSPMQYQLSSVSSGSCSQALSQSISVSASALPTASVSANPTSVCENQNSVVTFSGTPNAIVTYKVNSGANQTITLNASGSATLTTPALTSASTYTIVNVSAGSCSQVLNNSVTIGVNPLPGASIASNSPVCSGSSALVSFSGSPNAVVTYTVNSGASQTITLNASGSASVAIPNVTSPQNYALVNVALGGCSQALSQTALVSSVALPTATISANATTVCAGQASTIIFSGTPNAEISYSDASGNQTITLDSSGSASVNLTLSANTTFQLNSASFGATGCSQALSGSVTVVVNPIPAASFSGNVSYCEGESTAINLSGAAGTTFSWTVAQNGTTGATSGSGNAISQTLGLSADEPGTAIYTVTPYLNGCAGNPIPIAVTVYPLPKPAIADGVICTSSLNPNIQFYTLDTQLNPADYSFEWFFGGNPILAGSGSTYQASQTGVYTVIATSASGCTSAPVQATVTQMPQGDSLSISQSAAFSDHPTVTVTVVGGGGPFTYQLDDLSQASNVFHDISAGTHYITVTDENCTNLSAIVTIVDYPKFFTPNNDGFHDTWQIEGLPDGIVQIFDRYGKLLKQLSVDGPGWDGTYNGHTLPSTDYWFTIDYSENGSSRTFKSHFALKR